MNKFHPTGVTGLYEGPRPGRGWLGAVAGVLALAATWLPRVDESLYGVWIALASSILLWQLGLGLWLLIRGTKQAEDLAVLRLPSFPE